MAERGKRRIVFRPSAAYTATFTSRAFTTPYHNGMVLTLRATALAATPDVAIKIQGWDTDGSGTWVDLLVAASVTTASPTVKQLKLYPGSITAAGLALDLPLPEKWRVIATHLDTDSITYELFAVLFAA